MSLPANHGFDYSRINDMTRYNGLRTNKDRIAFMFMVSDFMEYVRHRSSVTGQPGTIAEIGIAANFVTAITAAEPAWKVARQMVPEFQTPAKNVDQLNEPLRTVMKGVVNRLDPPKITLPDEQRIEEDIVSRRWRRQFEYINYYDGLLAATPVARQKEVAVAIANMSKATGSTPLLGTPMSETSNAAASGDGTQTGPPPGQGQRKRQSKKPKGQGGKAGGSKKT